MATGRRQDRIHGLIGKWRSGRQIALAGLCLLYYRKIAMSSEFGKCASCREFGVAQVTIPVYTIDLEHDGRRYSVTVHNIAVLKCGSCGNQVIPDESDERISEELRRQAGFLFPEEIRKKREALGLSQESLAEHLRVSVATLSRWETGGQIQQRAMDRLLRLYFEVPQARQYLNSDGQRGKVAI